MKKRCEYFFLLYINLDTITGPLDKLDRTLKAQL